jgi:tetratricopeptide (TPR) repeat protein
MRLALYLLLFLGSVLLVLDLMKQVKAIEPAPVPEPEAKPTATAAPVEAATPSNPHDQGHPDIQQALEKYTQAIQEAPDQAKPYVDRANAYIAMGQYDKAITDLDQALKFEPQNTAYLVQRGYIQLSLKQSDMAIADFSKAIEIDPKFTKAFVYRAITNFRNDAFQPALDDCLIILENDPTFTDLHITIAQCYKGLGQLPKANEHLDLYLKSTSDPQGKKEAEALKKEWAQSAQSVESK